MTISQDDRQAIRDQYHFACGYCSASEIDVGSELEIDHFQPVSHGGTDERENLVYTYSACNRNKASYWPLPDAPPYMHLLHPLTDDLHDHMALLQDGRLAGLTPQGWFHIEWLHLNRPQLIMLRGKNRLFTSVPNYSLRKYKKSIASYKNRLRHKKENWIFFVNKSAA